MSISDFTNLYPDGLPISDGPQWPWTPATKWHEATERPTHDGPVLAYVRWNDDGTLFPAFLMAKEPDWDDKNRWLWTFDGEEVIWADGRYELYTVMCWREVPPPPKFARR